MAKPIKRMKKQVKGLAETSMIMGGSSIAIGALGGTSPFTGMSSMMPAMGSVIGAGGLIGMVDHSFGDKKKKKYKKLKRR